MLRLRKILLCDIVFYGIFFLSILQLVIRLSIPKKSILKDTNHSFTGIVEEIKRKEEKTTITIKNKERVIGTYYEKENGIFPKLHLGDKVRVEGEFKRPSSNTTEYLFNYQKYCRRKNIFYLVEIEKIKVLKRSQNVYYRLKDTLNNSIKNPYVKTFILGDKSEIKEEVKRSYQENGISHLFAISGMHISLLVNMIEKFLKKLKQKEQLIFQITSFFLLCYLLILGFSPSIVRAILFYFFFSLNRIYYFYVKPKNIFLFVLSISLILNPYYIYDTGFLYSYSISYALLSIGKDLEGKNYFSSLLKTSSVAFIVSIPISIYTYYQINILGILYNLIFVPFVSMLLFPLSLIILLIPPLEILYNPLIKILEMISLFLSKITIGKIIMKHIPFPFYLFYGFIIFFYINTKNKKVLIIFLFLLSIHLFLPFFDQREYLKMIDIGQGDSILLHSKNKNILVDTGGYESFGPNRDGTIFYHTLQPLFRSEGIRSLDYLILTHGDKDHLGEAKTIIENMKVRKIIINDNKMNYYEKQLPKKKTRKGKQGFYIHLNHIRMWQLNEDLEDENDSSQIYYVTWNKKTMLLTGDASIKSEQLLLENYDLGHIDILKAGHHGSKTSTSEELLKEITPNLALISCGRDNKFKHPNTETIEKLKKHHILYHRTDKEGTITINMKKKKWSIKTCI